MIVKRSLPIALVAQIVDSVASACVKANEDGRLYCDYVSKKLNTDVNFLVHFADYKFGNKNDIAEYDNLVAEGVLDRFYAKVDKDYVENIKRMIDAEIEQQIVLANSVETSVAKAVVYLADALDFIKDKLPSSEQMEKTIKGLSKEIKELGDLKIMGGKDAPKN